MDLFKRFLEGMWLWNDGSMLTWTAWLDTEPNNDEDRDCLGLVKESCFSTVGWKAEFCGYHLPFICELPDNQGGR